jgi:hypothetical protein
VSAPAAEPIRSFEEIGELFDKLADALSVIVGNWGPRWAEGSPAERDCRLDDSLDGTPHLTAATLVGSCLNHTQDHLRVLARATAHPKVVMGGYTMVRPVLGSASRAMWLLEPDITPTERVRRGMNLRLSGIKEMQNLLGDRDPEVLRQLVDDDRDAMATIAQQAHALGLPRPQPKKGRDWEPHYIRESVPKDMKLVSALLDRDGSDPTGELIFRMSSAFVHGEHHLMRLLEQQITPVPGITGVSTMRLRVDLYKFVSFLASVPVGIQHVALAAVRYAGLPDEVWQDLAQPLMHRWQATLRIVANTNFQGRAS